MTTQESNLRFISAILNWLSLFPETTISCHDSYSKLCNPETIIDILHLILDENFQVDYQTYEFEKKLMMIDIFDYDALIREYELIFTSVRCYLKANMFSRKRMYKYLDLLKFEDLAQGEVFSISILCFIFLDIGIHSFKSSVAISQISLLSDEDQKELKNFMFDEEDLTGKNLILNQRLNLLELENFGLKNELKLKMQEFVCFKNNSKLKEQDDYGTVDEYVRCLKLKEEKLELTSDELKRVKATNRDLKQEISQLNNDLDILNLKSLETKKTNLRQSFNNKRIFKASEEIDSPYELLKWEYNLLSEWIFRTNKNKRIR